MEDLRNLNNREFYDLINKPDEEFEKFLTKCGLLGGEQKEYVCGGTMNKRDRGVKGVTYRCTTRNCRKEVGRRKGTFFDKSNLSYKDIFEMSYLWCHDEFSIRSAKRNLTNGRTISPNTVVDRRQFFRDICSHYFDRNPIVIGGPGIKVQIDETVVTKRKYGRGRVPASEWWFFGGYEPVSGRAFMIPVRRRNRRTLIPLIRRFIAAGSIIISDMWGAYRTISSLPEGYQHRTVNHSRNFVDPITKVHTNAIESLWQKFKMRHKKEYGTARTLMKQYMIQFLWSRLFKDDPFYNFWLQVKQRYVL